MPMTLFNETSINLIVPMTPPRRPHQRVTDWHSTVQASFNGSRNPSVYTAQTDLVRWLGRWYVCVLHRGSNCSPSRLRPTAPLTLQRWIFWTRWMVVQPQNREIHEKHLFFGNAFRFLYSGSTPFWSVRHSSDPTKHQTSSYSGLWF